MNRAIFRQFALVRPSRHLVVAAGAVVLAGWLAGCAHMPFAIHDAGAKGPSTIAGQVTSDRGAVIADAQVSLSSKHAAEGAAVRRQVKTDIAGRYSFENVPLGSYELVATASGYKSAKQKLTVEKEGTVRANLKVGM